MANPKFVLRSLDTFVMYTPTLLPPFAVAGTTGILAAINKEQGINLLTRQFTYGTLTPTTGDTLYNTSLVLNSVVGQGYQGSFTLRYNRVDLSLAFTGKTLTLPGTFTDVYSALSAINSAFGIALEQRDLVNSVIALPGGQITLTVSSTSLYYLPGSVIKINGPIPFATVAPVTDLNSFDPEPADLSVVINGSTISWD